MISSIYYRVATFLCFLFVLTLLWGGSEGASAQPVDSLILKGKELAENGYDAADTKQLRRAASLFRRATNREEHTALSHYYVGLTHKRLVDISRENTKEEDITHLDTAIDHLETSIAKDDDFAEAHALLSGAFGRKIGKKPELGMFLGPKSSKEMKRAKRLAPDNPRVVLMSAISDLMTPEKWGGNPEKSIDGFERAIQLFESYEPESPLHPDWGYSESYAWLGIAHMKQKNHCKARTTFEQALEIDSDFSWVREVLLPKAKKKLDSNCDPNVSTRVDTDG